MLILFADGVPEVLAELPRDVQQRAAHSIELISAFPRMYPVRRRGLMRQYRYFVVDRFLFYYSVAATEIRITAIIPAAMRRA
jgi:plasmid stabilization system protein ParE